MVTMKRNKKVVLILALSVGIISCVFGLIYMIKNPKILAEERLLYNYTFQPNLSYKVYLVENELYDTIQEEGAIYIKNILDYIEIDFSTNYQASETVPLDMEYTIIARVIGYSSSNGGRIDYWSKDFPLEETKTLFVETDYLQEEKSLQLKLDTYEDFAGDANKLTGVNLSTELTVRMMGKITATTPFGIKDTPFDINMNIPLQENLIEITKGSMQSTTDKFTDRIVQTVPLKVKYIVLISIVIVLLISGLLFTIFFIYAPLFQEILRSEVKKIIKNNGSRMIALGHRSNKIFNHTYEVASLKDLLILSDEIQRPIYYIVDKEEFVKDYMFHVEDKDDIYIYKHTSSYGKELYYDKSVDINSLMELQQEDADESSVYQIPNG